MLDQRHEAPGWRGEVGPPRSAAPSSHHDLYFLDLAHQIEILELCRALNAAGRTIVAVLHDLNQASRYASRLVVMKDGLVRSEGPPCEIVNEALVEAVFGLACIVVPDPVTGTPMIVPKADRPSSV